MFLGVKRDEASKTFLENEEESGTETVGSSSSELLFSQTHMGQAHLKFRVIMLVEFLPMSIFPQFHHFTYALC